jgi:tetraacyldisaccharide 4'-kinase
MSTGLRSLLFPLTPLYRLALAMRERRLATGREPIRRLRFPVISIGNLSTGGAGKTPLTIALAQALTARGVSVDVLSRGYGRRSTQLARVDPAGSPDDYGDEPLLIARTANLPVYVARQRYDAGLLAESALTSPVSGQDLTACGRTPGSERSVSGHDFSRAEKAPNEDAGFSPCAPRIHLLDDGFQHRQLHRDLDILLLARADLDDHLFPAGNLREALHAATRAHIIAIPTTDPTLESDLRARGLTQPIWRLHRRMQIPSVSSPVLAFCGIARPHQFFAGLADAGVDLAAHIAFPDHHRYTPRDLDRLDRKARATGATTLLTTEKDAIRLCGLPSPLPIVTVPLCTEIEDTPAAINWLLDRLRDRLNLSLPHA